MQQAAKLVWITPDAETLLVHMARVSNPRSQETGDNPEKLIRYLIRNRHWSPFEMVSACVEVNTTRDIARQMLRHRSFSFQEFSQRYAVADDLGDRVFRPARLQDEKNRQNSLATDNDDLQAWWHEIQDDLADRARADYRAALARGIAKEVARAILPEGMTPSRLYMAGSVRSWMHYLAVRLDPSTQLEHRELAQAIAAELRPHLPAVFEATDERTANDGH
jgi:thymidylate synthase (FAD)